MKAASITLACVAAGLLLGCQPDSADGPPTVRLGESVCDECNMIISDDRWATATIFEGERGPEARLFDDFNCQVNFELQHEELKVITRWSHGYADSAWIRTHEASFVASPALRTPMASGYAAFATKAQAEAFRAEATGDLLDFATAWKRLDLAGACCRDTDAEESKDK